MWMRMVFFFQCMCVTDQEGGRWRSVSPEGALRVGLRSEGEGDGKNGVSLNMI